MSQVRIGNQFERMFQQSCMAHGIAVTRVPDGCKQLGQKLIRVKTPFDWILSHSGRFAVIDTKSYQGNMPHADITKHQILELIRHEEEGSSAGYVIYFRKALAVGFIRATNLYDRLLSRGSIAPMDTQIMGPPSNIDPRGIWMRT